MISQAWEVTVTAEKISASFNNVKDKTDGYVEPISKSPEEDNEAGELNEAKEVLWMIFPSDEDPTLPLEYVEQVFNEGRQDMQEGQCVLPRKDHD